MQNNKNTDTDLAEQIALFRYGLIAQVVRMEPGTQGIYKRLREIAGQEYIIPGSRRRRVATDTLRTWVTRYRARGINGLYPKRRTDRGKPRKLAQETVDVILSVKENNTTLTVRRP